MRILFFLCLGSLLHGQHIVFKNFSQCESRLQDDFVLHCAHRPIALYRPSGMFSAQTFKNQKTNKWNRLVLDFPLLSISSRDFRRIEQQLSLLQDRGYAITCQKLGGAEGGICLLIDFDPLFIEVSHGVCGRQATEYRISLVKKKALKVLGERLYYSRFAC